MLPRLLALTALVALGVAPAAADIALPSSKLDPALALRAASPQGRSRVIVHTQDGAGAVALIHALNGTVGRRLTGLGALVADVPDHALAVLAEDPRIVTLSLDRPIFATMARTSATIGAGWVRRQLGYDGAGVGVAIIDSGVTSWHDDLTWAGVRPRAGAVRRGIAESGAQRVLHFVDFVNFWPTPYDDYGHGTHVAGIVAGNGHDSGGARAGVAPGAALVALKVLDSRGGGHISNVIAAIDYAIAHRDYFNLRVINLSVAAGVYDSYWNDPLALAAQRAVEAGMVVVTAAGNLGRDAGGGARYGGITAPGNAPWVLTVGASTHGGTTAREDDVVAPFSSRGPTRIDRQAKPDVVAPGVGIESLSDPGSYFYTRHADALLPGTLPTAYLPYLGLSGTSMAAPVVAGTVALMYQANPHLTPNAVKAILQYTAEVQPAHDHLTQGAGFLNARGAVELARFFAGDYEGGAETTSWGRRLIWGAHRLGGGLPLPAANAWTPSTVWGAAFTGAGDAVFWGARCEPALCDRMIEGSGESAGMPAWGTSCADAACTAILWGAAGDFEDLVQDGPGTAAAVRPDPAVPLPAGLPFDATRPAGTPPAFIERHWTGVAAPR
jgi:serine protease AprX